MIENKKQKKKVVNTNKKTLVTKSSKNNTNRINSVAHGFVTQSTDLQKKLINHLTISGKKHKSEKIITKSFKACQKAQKKNHSKITKLSILNTIPVFKVIKLTDKKRRKKSTREIPTLVSSYTSRVSLGLKYLVKTSNTGVQTKQIAFFKKLKNELLSGTLAENSASALKNNFQTKALQEKKYFRFYRW